jgi:hypothetical protein
LYTDILKLSTSIAVSIFRSFNIRVPEYAKTKHGYTLKDFRYTWPNGENKITAGQAGLACVNANRIGDRQQEPVGNREGVMPVASK